MRNIIYKLHVVSLLILEQIYTNHNHISKYYRDIEQTGDYNGRIGKLKVIIYQLTQKDIFWRLCHIDRMGDISDIILREGFDLHRPLVQFFVLTTLRVLEPRLHSQ